MRYLAIIALLVPIAAAPVGQQAVGAAARPVCQNTDRSLADRPGQPARAHPLTAEPNAKQILAVLRTVDGCTRPVVVREDVGPKLR